MRFFVFNNRKKIDELTKKLENLHKELSIATEFVESVTKGSLTTQIDHLSFQEATLLAKALKEMNFQLNELNQKEKQRNWAIEGQAQFGELIRKNNQDIKELADQLIKFLIHYLKATQGGIFVLNEENSQNIFLELKASYAYNRKKFEKKIISIEQDYAEGLIGQVFLEGRTFSIQQLPQDYLRVTSGLGEANPSYLILVPLKTNDKIFGILELASFQPFEDYQIEFLEKISEGIATSLAMVKNNEITRNLLKESQAQADILRAQEEELRQNNEELMTTQEEMQRRGNELNSQIETINRSGIILVEFTPEAFILDANDAFYNLFQYNTEEIIGQNHLVLKTGEEKKYTNQNEFWKDLNEGIAKAGEYLFASKENQKIWLKGGYSPILDANKKVHKVILIAFDISDSKKQLEEINLQASKLQSQEAILKRNNEQLLKTRDELQQKIEELNHFRAEEEQRLKERDAKAQAWVTKLNDKAKKQEETLKKQIEEKNLMIQDLETKLMKMMESSENSIPKH